MKVKIEVKQVQDNSDELLVRIKSLTGYEVLVGVPAENAGRSDGPINNAAIAYIQNYGSPTQNIPARPFLEPGIESVKTPITALLKTGGQRVLDGAGNVMDALTAVGQVATIAIKRKITSNIPPPLAPSTIAARVAQGVTSTNTLVRTGKLLNSITFVVRKKGVSAR